MKDPRIITAVPLTEFCYTPAAHKTVRTTMLKATHGSPTSLLRIGLSEIPCYVLADGRRVTTLSGVNSIMGVWDSRPLHRVVDFLTTLISKGVECSSLLRRVQNPIIFRTPKNVQAYGYEGTIVVELCDIVLEARSRGILHYQQIDMAYQCELIIRALARIGIIALMDEVTGYQKYRPSDALQKLYDLYITQECSRWEKKFQDGFYSEVCRLWGWDYSKGPNRLPRYLGKLTKKLIYDRIHPQLARGLKDTKKESGVTDDVKWHQFMETPEGKTRLREQIEGVIMIMKFSESKDELMTRMDKAYPLSAQYA